MKRLLLSLILLVGAFISSAQTWQSVVSSNATDQNSGDCIRLHKGKQYFAGTFKESLNVGFNSIQGMAFDDIFLGKADLDGYTEWLIGISGNQLDRPSAMTFVDDYILLAGNFSDSLFIGSDTVVNQHQTAVFLAYFDTLGNHLGTIIPDAYNMSISDMEVDKNGYVLMCGTFYQHFSYGNFSISQPAGLNFFLAKYDPFQDEFIWAAHASEGSSDGRRLSVGEHNSIYVVGQYNDGTLMVDTMLYTDNINHNLFVSKFDSTGVQEWVKTIEGTEEVHGYGVVADSNALYITGEFEGDVNVGSNLLSSEGFYDILTVKYDLDGNVIWSNSIGGPQSDEGYDVVIDGNGDPVVMVELGDSVFVQSGLLDINGWNEPALIKVKGDDGSLIWYKNLKSTLGTGLVEAVDMDCDEGVIAITGINRSAIELSQSVYVSLNSKDFYSAILNDSLTYNVNVSEISVDHGLNAYPNPTSNEINIVSDKTIRKVSCYNLVGNKLFEREEASSAVKYDFSTKPAGVYYLRIETERGFFNLNLVVN